VPVAVRGLVNGTCERESDVAVRLKLYHEWRANARHLPILAPSDPQTRFAGETIAVLPVIAII
jgi:hypothetical protein